MTLHEQMQSFMATPEPADLGPGPRAGISPLAELHRRLEELLGNGGIAVTPASLLRAAVLLWHDHLDAAHELAQEVENQDGSYLHAIMHRREPDYGNAKYWFRRVGQHPCFPELSTRVSEMLASNKGAALSTRLIAGGRWDAYGFVDACEEAADLPSDDARAKALREIQKIEFSVLLEHLTRNH